MTQKLGTRVVRADLIAAFIRREPSAVSLRGDSVANVTALLAHYPGRFRRADLDAAA